MITIQHAKDIVNSNTNSPKLMIDVVERYIYDKKQIEVKINTPNNFTNAGLLEIAFECAKQYYKTITDKF
jgi:hypothetical protein